MSTHRSLAAIAAPFVLIGAVLLGPQPAGAGQDPPDLIASDGDVLLHFNSATPGTVTEVPVTPPAGTGLAGIATRPATQAVYGLFRNPQTEVMSVGLIDHTNGSVSAVVPLTNANGGTPIEIGFVGIGLEFNPVADRLRIVTSSGDNLRVDVTTGATTVDTALNGEAGGEGVTAVAYTNVAPSVAPPASTTLFDITAETDVLAIQAPPNDGTLTAVGPLGVNAVQSAGFTVAHSGAAFAILDTPLGEQENALALRSKRAAVGATDTGFYSVDLATGAVTLVGAFGGSGGVDSLTAFPGQIPPPASTTTSTTTSAPGVGGTTATTVLARTGQAQVETSAVAVLLVAAGGLLLVVAMRLRLRPR